MEYIIFIHLFWLTLVHALYTLCIIVTGELKSYKVSVFLFWNLSFDS